MHWFEPGARRRGRSTGLLLLSALFLLVSLYSEAAFSASPSASLIVTIKQVNPAGGLQTVTCAVKQKCLLPVTIQNGSQRETVTAHILFVPGNVMFAFETHDGYLYARDKNADPKYPFYKTMWATAVSPNKSSTRDVTLFLPAVPLAALARIVKTVQQPVAELEITMEAAP
jgi:hypothetical protein